MSSGVNQAMSTEKTMDHADTCGATYISKDDAFDLAQTLRTGPFQNGDAQGAVTHRFANLVIARHERMRSAAPELVEALKHLLDALEGPSRTPLEDIEIAICAGRAALSKALGTPVSGPGGER